VPRPPKVTKVIGPSVTKVTGIAGRRCVLNRADARMTQIGPIGPDRTLPRSDCRWFQVFVSMLFFLGKWTDWTDGTGITVGCSVRTATSCISSREHTMRQRQGTQRRIANPALHSLNNFKERTERLAKARHSIAPKIARKPPGQVACTSPLPGNGTDRPSLRRFSPAGFRERSGSRFRPSPCRPRPG